MKKPFQLSVVELCLYLVPFALLLIGTWLFFPYITLKALTFRALVQIAGFFYVWLILKYPEYRPKKSFLTWAVFIFLLTSILTTIISTSTYFSFFGNAERMDGLFSLSHWILFFFIFLGLAGRKKEVLKNFLLSLFIAGLLISLIGILQYFGLASKLSPALGPDGPNVREAGTFGNPAYLGTFGVLMLIMGAYALLEPSLKNLNYLAGINIVLGLSDILISGTRSAVAGLAVGIFAAVIFLAWQKENLKIKRIALISLVVLAILAAVFWFVRNEAWFARIPAIGRFSNVLKGGDTSVIRLVVWKSFLKSYAERPILGWGLEQNVPAFSKHFNPKLTGYEDAWFDRPHNKFLEVLTDQGIIGFLAYLGLLASAGFLIIKSFKEKRVGLKAAAGLTGFLFAYMANNFFLFDIQASYTVFFGFLVIVANLAQEPVSSAKNNFSPKFSFKEYLIILGAVLALVMLLVYDWHNYQSLEYISKANFDFANNKPVQTLADWENAYNVSISFHEEVAQNFTSMSQLLAHADPSLAQRAMFDNISWLESAIRNNPLNSRNYLFYLQALSYLSPQSPGIQSKVEQAVTQAQELAPEFPELYVQESISYVVLGDYHQAEFYIKKALELTQAIPRAYFVYTYIAKQEGNFPLASQMAQTAIEKGYPWSQGSNQISFFAYIFGKAGNQKELDYMNNYLKQSGSPYQLK